MEQINKFLQPEVTEIADFKTKKKMNDQLKG